jgi:hypothetical protein
MWAQVCFWSGPKRFPRVQEFSEDDTLHMDFIVAATKLLAHLFGIDDHVSMEEIHDVLKTAPVPKFEPKKGAITPPPRPMISLWKISKYYLFFLFFLVKIQTEPGQEVEPAMDDHDADEDAIARIIASLPDRNAVGNWR